jgi:hypothetical protein
MTCHCEIKEVGGELIPRLEGYLKEINVCRGSIGPQYQTFYRCSKCKCTQKISDKRKIVGA